MRFPKFPQPSMFDAFVPLTPPSQVFTRPDNQLADIMSMIYDAAIGQDDLWPEALLGLRAAFSARGARIVSPIFETRGYHFNLISTEDLGLSGYRNNKKKNLGTEWQTFQDVGLGIHAAYKDCCVSSDIHRALGSTERRIASGEVTANHARYICINRIEAPVWDSLILTRSINDPPFTKEDCERLGAVQRDFRRIVAILHSHIKDSQELSEVAPALEKIDSPLGIANGYGDILFNNAAALNLLGNIRPFANYNPQKSLSDQQTPKGWQTKWMECVRHALQTGQSSIAKEQIKIALKAFKAPFFGREFKGSIDGSNTLLLAYDSYKPHRTDKISQYLSHADLTEVENEIIELFKEGKNAAQIAQIREKSLNTIRAQFRSIRTKFSAKNQTELLAKIKKFSEN